MTAAHCKRLQPHCSVVVRGTAATDCSPIATAATAAPYRGAVQWQWQSAPGTVPPSGLASNGETRRSWSPPGGLFDEALDRVSHAHGQRRSRNRKEAQSMGLSEPVRW